jgi:hypothetical protein
MDRPPDLPEPVEGEVVEYEVEELEPAIIVTVSDREPLGHAGLPIGVLVAFAVVVLLIRHIRHRAEHQPQ